MTDAELMDDVRDAAKVLRRAINVAERAGLDVTIEHETLKRVGFTKEARYTIGIKVTGSRPL